MGKYVELLNARIKLAEKSTYVRASYQSYMTGPEWRNVEMSEEFANFLRHDNTMFGFPYFRQTFGLWKVFYHSYRAAAARAGHANVLTSEYMVMDLFVTLFTTLEWLPKGAFALVLWPFLKSENTSAMQRHLADCYQTYAQNLETVPFYDHPYADMHQDLSEKYQAEANNTWADAFSWKVVATELKAKRWISAPLQSWFHQEDNQAPASTTVIVKSHIQGVDNPDAAKALFKEKLKGSEANQVSILHDHVYVKDGQKTRDEQSYFSVYAIIDVPRYRAFVDALKTLAAEQIHLRKIAGQDKVQVKITSQNPSPPTLENTTLLYQYGNTVQQNRFFRMYDVPVKNLHATVEAMLEQDGEPSVFIHNF